MKNPDPSLEVDEPVDRALRVAIAEMREGIAVRPEWRAEVKRLERQIVNRFADAAGALGHPIPSRAAAFLVLGAANWTYYWYDPDGDLSVEDLARGAAAVFTAPVTAP